MASKTTLVFVTMLFCLSCSMSIRGQDLSKHLVIENGSKLGFTRGPQATKSSENSSSGGSTKAEQRAYVHNAGYYSKGFLGSTLWHGVRAKITVWNIPDVEPLSSSGAYITAINQSPGQEFIAAGVHVNPSLYKDNLVHFFTYWTLKHWKKDTTYYANGLKIAQVMSSYRSWTQFPMTMGTNTESTSDYSTGCYNNICPGFVVANGSNLSPGDAFHPPLSTYGGEQRSITIRIKKDEHTGDWSLYREDLGGPIDGMTLLGWWPGSLFKTLSECAKTIQWTGFVTHNYNETSPSMGSGHFSTELDGKAASFEDCFGFDLSGNIFYNNYDPLTYEDKPDCYDVSKWYETKHSARRHFFYGGPGGCSE